MYDPKDLLAVFQLELPDANEQLFLQRSRNTKTFEHFPKLPLELRLSVWRLTFPPPRHVDLSQDGYHDLEFNMYLQCPPDIRLKLRNSKRLRNYFPISLFVNQESRQETFRHYRVSLLNDRHLKNPRKIPLCLNLHLDTVFFDGQGDRISEFELLEWVDYVSTTVPGVFSGIQTLEFRDIENGNGSLPRWSGVWYRERFPSLETVCITLQRPSLEYNEDELKEMLQEAKEWMDAEENSTSGSRRNIEVIVRRWEKLSVGPLILEGRSE